MSTVPSREGAMVPVQNCLDLVMVRKDDIQNLRPARNMCPGSSQ